MKLVRVFTKPTGEIRIVHPNPKARNPGESDQDFYSRVFARTLQADPTLQGLPFVDIDPVDLPTDRVKRHAWRLNPQNKVIPDLSVPEPRRPDQSIIDDVENATNIGQLKAAMVRWMKG